METSIPFSSLFKHYGTCNLLVAQSLVQTPDSTGIKFFTHYMQAGNLWRMRIKGIDTKGITVWPEPIQVGELINVAEVDIKAWNTLFSGDEIGDINRIITYTNTQNKLYESKLIDVLTHFTIHAAHHRGQICTFIRIAGGVPPVLDYIALTRKEIR